MKRTLSYTEPTRSVAIINAELEAAIKRVDALRDELATCNQDLKGHLPTYLYAQLVDTGRLTRYTSAYESGTYRKHMPTDSKTKLTITMDGVNRVFSWECDEGDYSEDIPTEADIDELLNEIYRGTGDIKDDWTRCLNACQQNAADALALLAYLKFRESGYTPEELGTSYAR